MIVLTQNDIEQVNGGLICGGLCVLGAFAAGAGLMAAGVAIGQAIGKALN
ncbi:hypothetical protein GCM10009098_10400 [Rheinheimera aquimaris]|uniref:Class IIb bacteriocin, lactobin A/cerein 7B family n=1 Tax=Rheinheimera aquimaris TaxID=412437 RepID=A0ABN1DJY1_9GAMM|nr:hypothetical protein [Rheinheimera aquimaris]MCB5212887.1 hypothetical protein [Rheinheimera aquimaris]